MTQSSAPKNRACTQTECDVTAQDLPLSCPLPNDRLLDAHPRVYLPIQKTGREMCPYCGTIYRLVLPNMHE